MTAPRKCNWWTIDDSVEYTGRVYNKKWHYVIVANSVGTQLVWYRSKNLQVCQFVALILVRHAWSRRWYIFCKSDYLQVTCLESNTYCSKIRCCWLRLALLCGSAYGKKWEPGRRVETAGRNIDGDRDMTHVALSERGPAGDSLLARDDHGLAPQHTLHWYCHKSEEIMVVHRFGTVAAYELHSQIKSVFTWLCVGGVEAATKNAK